MKRCNSFAVGRCIRIAFGWVLLCLVAALPGFAQEGGPKRFDSPQVAADALKAAVDAMDTNSVHAIFGPAAHGIVSGDLVQAAAERAAFQRRLKEKITLVPETGGKVALELGKDAWPFPIPLVKQAGQWFFDVEAGREEILNRRIGADELGAIHVCRAYVQAQREYASVDRNGDGVLQYAQHLRSSPGTHDGLYWS